MAVEIYSPRRGLADGLVYIEVGSLCMLLFFFLGKGFHCRCDCPLQCGRQSLQVGTEVDYTHRKVLQSLIDGCGFVSACPSPVQSHEHSHTTGSCFDCF